MPEAERDRAVLDVTRESLRASGRLRFRARGTSMLPTIRPGTCVSVRSMRREEITTGDIEAGPVPRAQRFPCWWKWIEDILRAHYAGLIERENMRRGGIASGLVQIANVA
jgi:hypothetical protein